MVPHTKVISRLPVDGWHLKMLPNGLAIFTRAKNIADIQKASVLDVGSNSVKLASYDCSHSAAEEIKYGKYDKIFGLATGMQPDDPAAILNRKALSAIKKEAIPACRKVIDIINPDAIFVIMTEAARAALRNPAEIQTVEDFISDIAKGLGIDPDAIKVISEELEAELASKFRLLEGYSLMMGGASTELARFHRGKSETKWQKTIRIGTRTLTSIEATKGRSAARRRQYKIKQELAALPWFGPHNTLHKSKRKKTLCLQGGAFRVVGRLLAQRIYHISFRAETPFNGWSFACNDEFHKQLKSLAKATPEKMLEECIQFEYRHRYCIKNHEPTPKHAYKRWKENWQKTEEYKYWHDIFNKRVARRLAFIKTSIEVAVAAEKRTKPRDIVFGEHNTRIGVINAAGLG